MLTHAVRVIKPVMVSAERRISEILSFLCSHYTWLSVLAIFICGAAFIWIRTSMTRYSFYNYDMWKSRALSRSIYFGLLLVIIKVACIRIIK